MSSQDSAPHQSRREQRRSQRLRALASSAYTATAGHLEIEPEERDGRAPRRWFPEPAAAWALGLLLVLTAAVTIGWMALSGGGEAVPFGDGAAESEPLTGAEPEAAQSGTEQDAAEDQVELPEEGDAPDAASATSGEEARIVVHVAGAVAEPGLVDLPADARAGEAVDSAGGPAADADLSRVNLARPLTDGEQLYLPRIGEDAPEVTQPEPGAGAEAGTGSAGDAAPPEDATINISTADAAALEGLPGIGPARAQAIIEWREANGGFSAAEDLLQISGIGPATFERVQPLVTW